ncbi:hypothetical protein EMIT0P291_100050 [Pseudomonas sp. IT-P291]
MFERWGAVSINRMPGRLTGSTDLTVSALQSARLPPEPSDNARRTLRAITDIVEVYIVRLQAQLLL